MQRFASKKIRAAQLDGSCNITFTAFPYIVSISSISCSCNFLFNENTLTALIEPNGMINVFGTLIVDNYYGDQAIGRSKGGSPQRFIWLPRLPNLR